MRRAGSAGAYSFTNLALVTAGTLAPSKASQVVELLYDGGSCSAANSKRLGNRLVGASIAPFVIPAGDILVVTSMDLTLNVSPAPSTVEPRSAALELFDSTTAANVFVSWGQFLARPTVLPTGADSVSIPVPDVIVKPNFSICAASFDTDVFILDARLHGFLAPDK